jgi:hypothetical protein
MAMGNIGLQDTLPDLLRMASDDPDGNVRQGAFTSIMYLLLPVSPEDVVKRVRPGEKWQPLSPQARDQIARVALKALADPFKRYRGPSPDSSKPTYVMQNTGAGILRLLGYRVDQIEQEWRVTDSRGIVIAVVSTEKPPEPRQ